ncbi:protein arginine methyltransferase NDUFAF7 homolog, mitochondrial [Condylostylus longicornis]|uniref:protein arginine methyltransferase NDUFAF7 homolog, mitochondrial n=1 Tax=Condylostylus longicornis TaxID=2530218 RepID=UPI00244DB41D|nr:protein arginine methyltransferase NDUFAF7 homolog, mitochondrial [Condylostylus longicornis]XP_055384674.1 protein arginine methyltransferase NDUFAF7 homolog, mitochondrial [Condylostylus longicornis]XP_055384675.1 protein arginine methyltransferase NDUFAF7 homolog, mitochondrial [Condylostylus longicornis]XP_055384676.1 protein arginine methyltransferase NDUFAF7 homolog, mitochondrial [Condylostylus longicornis]
MYTGQQVLKSYIKNFPLYRTYAYKTIKRPDINKTPKKTASPKKETLEKATSLTGQLQAKILATGPITVADYMKEVLTNPTGGYYMQRDVFGVQGDFITSPEILQIFGELITIWCINEWQKIGTPSPLQIIELGPGRGTLARDVIKVLGHFKLKAEVSLHLIELSPFLSNVQAQSICYQHEEVDQTKTNDLFYRKGETATGIKVFWYKKLEDVPKKFSIVLANEFFDALPIHKFQKDVNVWKEILIDLDNSNQNKLRFVISKSQTPHSKFYQHIKNDERDCVEYSFEGAKIIELLATRLESYGGIALIIDYGHFGEKTDTFRAFKNHKLHNPLDDPGTADLTADVDFTHIKHHAEKDGKLITFGPVDQGIFIKRMEGDTRLNILLERCSPEQKQEIITGYDMLTNPEKMGSRFKVFAMFPAILKDYLEKFKVSGFH